MKNIEALLALIDAALLLAEKLPGAIKALQQDAELTEEQRTALDERIAKLETLPHWKV